jgi:cytochrome c oxidase subunit II
MRHGVRIAVIWLVVSIIVEVFVAILPIPSPTGSMEALGEHQTVYMLFYVGAPIFVFIWVLLVYNMVVFRHRAGDPDDERPAPPDSTPIMLLWAGLSFIIVLFLAGWGTFTLHEVTEQPHAPVALAQDANGTHTKALPTPKVLNIQVIGQEWFWTFRYPTYGGMETKELYVPVDTPIHFHVTSLDVVHSFWVYDYDVKEDAVPGVDNTAWMLARNTSSYNINGTDWVKCNELCGIWHGYMHNPLYVVSQSKFTSWAKKQYAYEKSTGLLKNLPKYASVYYPASNSNWPAAPQDQSP